jgi:hypothetical protein
MTRLLKEFRMNVIARTLCLGLACGFALALCGCNPIEMVQEQMAHSKAVSESLEKSTGLKSEVGFNWNNGKLTSVNVMFHGLPANVSLPDLGEKSRAAVLAEFKENPEHLMISFLVEK